MIDIKDRKWKVLICDAELSKILIALFCASLIGCASTPQNTLDYSHVPIIPSDETRKHPDYTKHFHQCDWYATSEQVGIGRSAANGALIGAGIAAATGLIIGIDGGYARLAGIGAAYGGLSSGAWAKMSNDQKYKTVMVQCLRDKGHHVY